MHYQWISAVFVISSIVALVIGLLFLVRKNWFWGWIKGTLGMIALLFALFLALTAINVNAYRPMTEDVSVATVSFDRLGPQRFKANVVVASAGSEIPFELTGDLWQVDARIIRWHGLLEKLGGKPGYKLDRIQGRYFTLEDERTKERMVYALSNPDIGFDLWALIDRLDESLAWFSADYGSVSFLPMADGALFTILISKEGLIARPENERAEAAVKNWE